jgi:hypothetical protein
MGRTQGQQTRRNRASSAGSSAAAAVGYRARSELRLLDFLGDSHPPGDPNEWDVQRIDKRGGTPQGLNGANEPHGLAIFGSTLCFASTQSGTLFCGNSSSQSFTALGGATMPWGVAMSASTAYYTENPNPGMVKSTPLGGGGSATVASDEARPWGIAVDAANVYWTTNDGGAVRKKALSSTGLPENLTGGPRGARGIAIDSTHAYWAVSAIRPAEPAAPSTAFRSVAEARSRSPRVRMGPRALHSTLARSTGRAAWRAR